MKKMYERHIIISINLAYMHKIDVINVFISPFEYAVANNTHYTPSFVLYCNTMKSITLIEQTHETYHFVSYMKCT